MSRLTDQIWIGSYEDIKQPFLNERKITHIFCCAEDVPLLPSNGLIGCRGSSEASQASDSARILDSWVKMGFNIMVYCSPDMRRSASVVIAYLMEYKKWSYELAYNHLKLRANLHSS